MSSRATLAALLGIRNYRLYFLGQNVSTAGSWMQNVALGWFVFEESGSGTALGLVIGLRFVPVLLFAMWGGLLSDRLEKRRILVATNLSIALASGAFGLLLVVDRASLIAACALALTLGLVASLQQPAQHAFVVEMVDKELLPNAIALNSTTTNVARIVGPSIAGLLLATLGAAWCFGINALSSLVIIGTLIAMNERQLHRSKPLPRSRGQLSEGLRYIKANPPLLIPLVATAVAGTFAWEFQVSLPMMASDAFGHGASAYGGLLSALGAGAVVGGLRGASRKSFTPTSVGWAAIGWGIAIILAALAPTFHVGLVLMAAVGYGAISFNSGSKTMMQLTAEPQFRGRVMGVWLIAWQGTTVVGAPLVGWIGEAFGARYALGTGGATLVLVGAVALPRLRLMTLPQRDEPLAPGPVDLASEA